MSEPDTCIPHSSAEPSRVRYERLRQRWCAAQPRTSAAGRQTSDTEPPRVAGCPSEYRWKHINVQVRNPRLEHVSCCNLCQGTWWSPFPITYEISVMSDSPYICSHMMVIRRWDEDFLKLAYHIRATSYGSSLLDGLRHYMPRRLASTSNEALELQCGRHKLMLLWMLNQEECLSCHALHAFLGCRHQSCPSIHTEAVRLFPPNPHALTRPAR